MASWESHHYERNSFSFVLALLNCCLCPYLKQFDFQSDSEYIVVAMCVLYFACTVTLSAN